MDIVEFRPPKGFQSPEGLKAGEDFDVVCTFRTKPSGEVCMVKLGDADMPVSRDYGNKPGYGEMANELVATKEARDKEAAASDE